MITSQRSKHFKFREKVLGQFFTPQTVSDFIVYFASIHLEHKSSACDPACGDGVFLESMLKYGFNEIVGMDVDEKCIENIPNFIKKKAKLFVGDALHRIITLDGKPSPLKEEHFDLVAGNPPFSAKYGRVRTKGILSAYKLAFGMKSQAIEVLFLERFIQLAKNGGIIAIILPDGIFLNLNYRKVREFILNNCKVLAVVSLPRAIFNSSKFTTSKTSILFAKKGERHEGKVFMVKVKKLSDLDQILNVYKSNASNKNALLFDVTSESLHPKTYISQEAPKFKLPTFRLKELINDMFCGGTEYGEKRKFVNKGIRFISAKVVTPLGIDFTKDHRKFVEPNSPMDKKRAHVKIGDVLFVRVGVGCIGRAAVITDEMDLGVADDWIYIIRVKKESVSPYYLTIFLQSACGKAQIERAKRGVGTVTIPQRLLKETLVPIPEAEFQKTLEREYKEMVKLQRKGHYSKAKKVFENMKIKVERRVKT
jgi:type I restriction enzyme M protein